MCTRCLKKLPLLFLTNTCLICFSEGLKFLQCKVVECWNVTPLLFGIWLVGNGCMVLLKLTGPVTGTLAHPESYVGCFAIHLVTTCLLVMMVLGRVLKKLVQVCRNFGPTCLLLLTKISSGVEALVTFWPWVQEMFGLLLAMRCRPRLGQWVVKLLNCVMALLAEPPSIIMYL